MPVCFSHFRRLVAMCLLVLATNALRADMLIRPRDRLAIVGDSITEQLLYSKYMETYLRACTPQLDIRVIQLGWGGETHASEGHIVRSADGGVITLESSRYPSCYSGGPTDPNGTASILPFLPFSQDLNRFTLVVTDLPMPMACVTWGNASARKSLISYRMQGYTAR